MKQTTQFINTFVFIAATLAIMGVFYEGMALEWYPIVGILILVMDYSFMLSSIINLIFYRKNKIIFLLSLFSIIMIVIAFSMKAAGIEYPIMSFIFWYFYIWFYYGTLIIYKPQSIKNK